MTSIASLLFSFPCYPTIVSVPVADMDSLASRVVQLVLSSSVKGGLHTRICPQLLDDISQLRGHCAFLNGVWQVLQLLCILLWFNAHRTKIHQHRLSTSTIYINILCQWTLRMLIMSGGHLLNVIWDLWRGCAKINAQHLHASDDGQSRLQDVAIDDRSKLHLFLFCVTTLMQNPMHK